MHASQDEEHQQLKAVILKGFPDHRELLDFCKQYILVGHNLTIDGDFIVITNTITDV